MYKIIWWLTLIFASVNVLLIPIGGGFNFGCAVIGFLICIIEANRVFDPQTYVFCARCDEKFVKSDSPVTAGYYDCSGDSYWANFVNPGEYTICDECMWATEGYRKIYGKVQS
jgi:hypothetical protein